MKPAAKHALIEKVRDFRTDLIEQSKRMKEEGDDLLIRSDQIMWDVRQLTKLIKQLEELTGE